jgi:hypothetical protein
MDRLQDIVAKQRRSPGVGRRGLKLNEGNLQLERDG